MLLNFFVKNVARGLRFNLKQERIYQGRIFQVTTIPPKRVTKVCGFHTSSPRNALPPILLFALRYVMKVGAIVSGRSIRKWWSRLSPEEKQKILDQIRSRKSKIAFSGTVVAGGIGLLCLEHMVQDPLTKRWKFMMLNQKQINQIAEFENHRQLQLFKSFIVPNSHPIYRRVLRVTTNLVLSNSHLSEIKKRIWTVTVIDRPDITNAFTLPNGCIFVFTGMLNICTNDDQLAVVLAHEMAHSILSHVAESLSRVFLLEFILLIPTIFFWIIFPDVWALFSEWITSSLAEIFIHLPFSRFIEREADMVGLYLAARSCYDIREAPVFWGKMKYLAKDFPIEWLSTHPKHESRQLDLMEFLPGALKVRETSSCPPLGPLFRPR